MVASESFSTVEKYEFWEYQYELAGNNQFTVSKEEALLMEAVPGTCSAAGDAGDLAESVVACPCGLVSRRLHICRGTLCCSCAYTDACTMTRKSVTCLVSCYMLSWHDCLDIS
jgi:hypothetical protein